MFGGYYTECNPQAENIWVVKEKSYFYTLMECRKANFSRLFSRFLLPLIVTISAIYFAKGKIVSVVTKDVRQSVKLFPFGDGWERYPNDTPFLRYGIRSVSGGWP